MESKIKRFESGHHCEGSGHRRIASGEMYPESGMSSRVSMTRPLADKSSFGTDGTGMLSNLSSRRCGADPPKNESGRIGITWLYAETSRYVSSGNGFCIAAANLSQREVVIANSVPQMRL